MNDLPSSSPRIARYAKLSSRARAVSIFLTVGVFASLLIFLNFEKSLSSAGGFSLLEIVPLAVIAIMYAVIMLSVLSTRRLNKVMRAFYLEHSHELGKQKAHLREATQLLIEKLQREIYSHNYEPNNYKFQLFNTNYRHINVVGTHGAKSVVMIKPKTVSFSSASKHSDAHSVATSSPSTTRKR